VCRCGHSDASHERYAGKCEFTDAIGHCECAGFKAKTSAETGTEPARGIGQKCHLCHNVHDLLSACPPSKTPLNCGCPNGSYSKKHRADCPLNQEGWICKSCGWNNGRALQCLNRECPSFAPKTKGEQP
jgi:hypothetical protein